MHVYLIGAGVIAQYHATATTRLPQPVQLSVTDPNPAALKAFLEKFPAARGAANQDALLAQPQHDTDIVIIATPPFAHHDPALAALNSGRHVLCEKPLALNLEQAHRMLAAAKKNNRLLACCSARFQNLSAPREARRLMSSGELGTPYHINWVNRRNRTRSGVEYQPQSRWFLDPKLSGGGCLMDWAPYDLAAITELLDPTRIDIQSAWLATPKTEIDPTDIEVEHHAAASLLVHRKDGSTIPITYERSSCTHGAERFGPEIECTRGAIKWDWLGGGKVHTSRDNNGKLETTTTNHPDADGLTPHDKPLLFLHRAIHNEPSPAITNEKALFNFSAIRAIYDAASTGQPKSVSL